MLVRLFLGLLCTAGIVFLNACKPEKSSELLPLVRQALKQAKSVESIIKKQDDSQRRMADEASK